MPPGNANQELQLQYLYGLRMIKQGWTAEQKAQLAEVLGRAAKWRGGAQFINFVGQFFDAVADLYTTDEEKQILYAKAPDFAPLTADEITEAQARQAAAGRGGRGGGAQGGRGATPQAALATRTAGRVVSRQEMFEETVYQPQQVLDVAAGQKVFEASCASCHRFGSVGNDHGVAGLNLTELEAARLEACAARGGLLPQPCGADGAGDDRDLDDRRPQGRRRRGERERAVSLASDGGGHDRGRRQEPGEEPPADQDVDHARRRWPRPSTAPGSGTSRRSWPRRRRPVAAPSGSRRALNSSISCTVSCMIFDAADTIAPAALLDRIGRGDAPIVLDVPSAAEFAAGHVPGAVNVPFTRILAGSDDLRVEKSASVLVYCGHGPRAWFAGTFLRRRGYARVTYLRGHMAAWRRAGLREER